MSVTPDSTAGGQAEETQVLTFALGGQDYCVGIDYVAEIVECGAMTPVPETDAHVEGVMDLRDRTTTIVDPYTLLEGEGSDVVTDGGSSDRRIIVLDSETLGMETPVGWLVSDVREVTTVAEDSVESDPTQDSDLLRGIVSGEEGFTIWLDPHDIVA